MSRGMKPVYDYGRIVTLHRQGVSNSAIATRMGCSTRTVRRAIERAKEAEHGDLRTLQGR